MARDVVSSLSVTCRTSSMPFESSIVRLHGGTLAIDFPAEGGCRVAVTLSTNGGRVTAM